MTDLARRESVMEEAIIGGNLANLSPGERVQYYKRVCESLGLNPLTKPFDYITLNGKLTLYARKDAADQLRSTRGVSIDKPDIQFQDEWIVVTVTARLPDGRTDSDIGCVNRKDMRGDFGNALMKAVTKAKRRVTLSICGLGILDETEVESIPGARVVHVDEPKQLEPTKEEPKPQESSLPHVLAMLRNSKSQQEFQLGLEAGRAAWNSWNKAQRDEFLTVKATVSAKLEGEQSRPPLTSGATTAGATSSSASASTHRSTQQTDRAHLGNEVFAAMTAFATATGRPLDSILRDMAEEYGVAVIDDLTTEQMVAALEWLKSRMPQKVGAA